MRLPELIVLVAKAAEEGARERLKFCEAGGKVWDGYTPAQVDVVRAALIEYAKQGAIEAVQYANRHGHLRGFE